MIIILLFHPIINYAESVEDNCKTRKIKYKIKFKTIHQSKNFCLGYNKEINNHYIISTECRERCSILKKPLKSIIVNKLLPGKGSLGHELCFKLDGNPQAIEYYYKSDWYNESICVFDKNRFVSISRLLNLWKWLIYVKE
ncbi:MAG: hypothetical protein HQK51_18120 [Oligoflexia bacterium]|nr:hypothetical protein [Oligoflexia bacterium]